MKSPTKKQINIVEKMTSILNIEFPSSSKEFNKFTYSRWINKHINEYQDIIDVTIYDEEYLYEICENDVWCEYY